VLSQPTLCDRWRREPSLTLRARSATG
jgi:hypothetical protein